MYAGNPNDMFDVGNSAARDNSEDKFLRYIHAEDYQGQGYTRFLAVERIREWSRCCGCQNVYDEKKRPYES